MRDSNEMLSIETEYEIWFSHMGVENISTPWGLVFRNLEEAQQVVKNMQNDENFLAKQGNRPVLRNYFVARATRSVVKLEA